VNVAVGNQDNRFMNLHHTDVVFKDRFCEKVYFGVNVPLSRVRDGQ
jgi:hypothetical protein